MESLAYESVKGAFNVASSIFFREIRSTGASQVPEKDPVIFIVGPHANQFVDPVCSFFVCRNSYYFTELTRISYNKLNFVNSLF